MVRSSGQYLPDSAGVSILPGTLSKGNTFNRNTYYGLQVNTDGAVTFNKVQADGNGYGGGYLTNNCHTKHASFLTSVNFNNNDEYGRMDLYRRQHHLEGRRSERAMARAAPTWMAITAPA